MLYSKFHKYISHDLIIMGDFNIITNDPNPSQLNILINQLGLTPQILQNTRPQFNKSNTSTIDQIYTNINKTNIYNSGILLEDLTDHLPIYTIIKIKTKIRNNSNEIKTRKITINNTKRLINALKNTNWDSVLEDNDAENSYNKFYTIYTSIINQFIPLLTNKISSNILSKNWITNKIKRDINKKYKLYKLYLDNKNEINLYNYKQLRNQLTLNIKKAKQSYIDSKIKNSISTKENWNLINNLINKQQIKQSPNYIIDEFENKFNNDKQIANAFNSYFINTSQSINNQFTSPINNINPINITPISKSIYLQPTSTHEINSIIQNNKSKTSLDTDYLNIKLLKISKDYIDLPLNHILNLYLSSGTFPLKMKLSSIKPIHKKNNINIISNYRPISILSQLSKILEKIIYNRLMQFIQNNNIINTTQYGFIKKHNTTQATLDIYNHIMENKKENKAINTLFLDLSKAFDTIEHSIIISKLDKYGIRGIPLKLIKNYLHNRTQLVKVNITESDIITNDIGVPQGSILGPLLFIIYVNDLPLYLEDNNVKFTVYADDTAITFTADNNIELTNLIKKTLIKIEKWYKYNKLKLNISKTEMINFNSNKYPNNIISLNDTLINNVYNYKYLGIILDSKLDFKNHIIKLNNKLSQIQFLISKLSKFIKTNSLIIIYNSIFLPYLNYGNIL